MPLEKAWLAISPITSLLHDFEECLIFSGTSVSSTPKWGLQLCLPQRHCFACPIFKKIALESLKLGLKHQESVRSHHY